MELMQNTRSLSHPTNVLSTRVASVRLKVFVEETFAVGAFICRGLNASLLFPMLNFLVLCAISHILFEISQLRIPYHLSMSGLEVIGGISAIITLLDASIKFYDSTRNNMKLPETFESVRRQLPVILHVLQTCANDLGPSKDSIPSDVCDALENILDSCCEKARKLREIFEMVIPGEKDTREKRYTKVIRRLGKNNKVEEIMAALTQDVQLLVNNHAVNSSTLEQNGKLEDILKEMKSIKSSALEEDCMALAFHSGGGAQTNNVQSGSGQQINNNANVGTQNFHSGKEQPSS